MASLLAASLFLARDVDLFAEHLAHVEATHGNVDDDGQRVVSAFLAKAVVTDDAMTPGELVQRGSMKAMTKFDGVSSGFCTYSS